MRKVALPIFIGLAVFPFLISSVNAAKPVKRALIIAIGTYAPETGWGEISSLNDTLLAQNALISQGFLPANIITIKDQQATKEGMTKALADLAGATNPGDIVYIHFSSHGQQIQDDNGDEMDGYDEAIVPYNAYMLYKKDPHKGKNHLRDEEFGKYLDQIRAKAGPTGNVIVVLDACHSGTATRGIGKSRGTDVKFQAPDYKPGTANGENKDFNEVGTGTALSPIVVFSASSANEKNYEYSVNDAESYGSLTYAFGKVFTAIDPKVSYRGLFDLIKAEMVSIAPRQTPQMEGDVDRVILGGKAVQQSPYFSVKKWYDEKNMKINGGQLVGVFDSSFVALYPIGTTNPMTAKAIDSGYIINATMLESEVSLLNGLPEETARKSWIFILRQNVGDKKTRVSLDPSLGPEFTNQFREAFKNSALVTISSAQPGAIIEMGKTRGTTLVATSSNDQVLFDKPFDPGNPDLTIAKAADAVRDFARVNFIKSIDQKNSSLDVRFELVPIVLKAGTRNQIEKVLPLSEKMTSDNQIKFDSGDYFQLKVYNLGNEVAYFNILDIQPDNKINILVPWKKDNKPIPAEECQVQPGDTITLEPFYRISPPYGNETFMLVAAKEPLEFEFLTRTKGEGKSGNNPFQKLYQDALKDRKRGGDQADIPPSAVNIYEQVFIISKK